MAQINEAIQLEEVNDNQSDQGESFHYGISKNRMWETLVSFPRVELCITKNSKDAFIWRKSLIVFFSDEMRKKKMSKRVLQTVEEAELAQFAAVSTPFTKTGRQSSSSGWFNYHISLRWIHIFSAFWGKNSLAYYPSWRGETRKTEGQINNFFWQEKTNSIEISF